MNEDPGSELLGQWMKGGDLHHRLLLRGSNAVVPKLFASCWRQHLCSLIPTMGTVKPEFHIILALKQHSSSKNDRLLWTETRPWTKFVIKHKLHYVGEEKEPATGWQICRGARGAPCEVISGRIHCEFWLTHGVTFLGGSCVEGRQ
jgi:hypothetical protein